MRAWEDYLKVKGWTSESVSVNRFLSHYKRKTGSESTKDHILDSLMAFSKYAEKSPDQLIFLDQKEASSLLQEFIDSLHGKGQGIRTINVSLAYLKTFFRVNGFKGDKELEVERYYQPSRYRKRAEYIPTAEEIFKMAYSSGSAKNKAMILTLYTTGLRNSTLRAILYKDIKEEVEQKEIVHVPVYPEMKKIASGACKGNIPYYSFISKEAVQEIRNYLTARKQEYGDIDSEEPLFISTSTNVSPIVRRKTVVKKRSLDEMVKRSAKKAEITKWKDVYPHCLRKAYESALRSGGLDVKDQEFLMGHILPGQQDTYYDKTKIETLRSRYAKVNFFPERTSSEEMRKRIMLDTAKMLGVSDDKIKKVEEALAKYEHIDEALDEIRKLTVKNSGEQNTDRNKRLLSGANQKEVRIVQGDGTLINFLNNGWDLVKELSSDKFVVQRSHDELKTEFGRGF